MTIKVKTRVIMDIDLLSKMVKELILDNDRVVLPGLGCFVAEMVPATFSDKGYTINPPYRRLYFRAKSDPDEGLVNFYASTNGLEKQVAARILGDFISELKTIIYNKKLVVLPGLGRLRATKENNIFFIADEDLDIYPAGFGLEPISLKTHKVGEQEVSDAVVGLKTILTEPVPVPQPTPEPTSVPEPVPEVAPVPEPAPVSVPEPTPEPEVTPALEVIPEPVATPEPAAAPAPAPAVEVEPTEEKKSSSSKKWLIAVIVVVATLLVLLVAYVVIARVSPGIFDNILYTPEELEILNKVL